MYRPVHPPAISNILGCSYPEFGVFDRVNKQWFNSFKSRTVSVQEIYFHFCLSIILCVESEDEVILRVNAF